MAAYIGNKCCQRQGEPNGYGYGYGYGYGSVCSV